MDIFPYAAVFHFNTGRLYQDYGQVIVVGITAEGYVDFNDLSRGVDGTLTTDHSLTPESHESTVRRQVMNDYDRSDWRDPRYKHIPSVERQHNLHRIGT